MTIVTSMRFELKFFWVAVSVIVYGLKIFGLAPFSVQIKKLGKNSSRNCTRAFLFSKMGLAYNIMLLVLIPIIVGIQFPRLLSMNGKYQSSVTQVSDISLRIFCVFAVWIVLISWTINQRKAASIMNKLVEIDAKLPGINKQPTNKMTYIFIITHVIINTLVWVIIWVSESAQTVFSDALVNNFFLTLPSFVIYWFIVEYFMLVGHVASKLEIINHNFSNFKEFCNCSSHPSFINNYLAAWSLSTQNELDALDLLRNIRTAIFNLAEDIAEFFSFPILACVAYFFFSLVYNVYSLITPAFLENGELPLAGSSSAVSWIFISLYPLTLLFFNVKKTVMQAELTGQLVHKLLSSAVKKEIKAELVLFSLQLLHENMNFTAYEFFSLDFSLLHSMLAATTTYLAILIQFK